tara:strand:+ start:7828 stop:8121 length:294 start_codon:yes stop_codon:yes gene_type:complete
MDLKKGKKLGMNVVLFGLGFVGGYYIYTGLFKQELTLPSVPPSLRKVPGMSYLMPAPAPVVEEEIVMPAPPPPPPTPLELAQANPEGVATALLYMNV